MLDNATIFGEMSKVKFSAAKYITLVGSELNRNKAGAELCQAQTSLS